MTAVELYRDTPQNVSLYYTYQQTKLFNSTIENSKYIYKYLF